MTSMATGSVTSSPIAQYNVFRGLSFENNLSEMRSIHLSMPLSRRKECVLYFSFSCSLHEVRGGKERRTVNTLSAYICSTFHTCFIYYCSIESSSIRFGITYWSAFSIHEMIKEPIWICLLCFRFAQFALSKFRIRSEICVSCVLFAAVVCDWDCLLFGQLVRNTCKSNHQH